VVFAILNSIALFSGHLFYARQGQNISYPFYPINPQSKLAGHSEQPDNVTFNKYSINFVLSGGPHDSAGRSRRTFSCKSPCRYAEKRSAPFDYAQGEKS
jgi:hypothetical protein